MPVRLTVFLPDTFVDRLDAWRRGQKNPPTRGMALRILAGRMMDAEGTPPEAPAGSEEPSNEEG
jgi:hypothetical protein